jgi:hypothetical protein
MLSLLVVVVIVVVAIVSSRNDTQYKCNINDMVVEGVITSTELTMHRV